MANCNEATLLMAKKEEGRLTVLEKIKLSMHTSMCALCRKFEKQTAMIAEECSHIHAEENLPEFARERIKKLLEEQI